jgi:hypothetical protein
MIREQDAEYGEGPQRSWGEGRSPSAAAAARNREAASTAQGPAQQGRGPDDAGQASAGGGRSPAQPP